MYINYIIKLKYYIRKKGKNREKGVYYDLVTS